jgi:Protein of unknown function with HXXEE motif
MMFRGLEWLFPIVVTLHNAEEAIWFPRWSKRAGRWHGSITPGTYRFAATVLSLLAFGVTYLSVRSGKQTTWTYLAFGYMAAMLVNVLIPHIAATIALRSYVPGVVTAVLLNLPVLTLLVVLAVREGYVSGWKAAEFGVGVAGALVASIPTLFKLGKLLNL